MRIPLSGEPNKTMFLTVMGKEIILENYVKKSREVDVSRGRFAGTRKMTFRY